MKQLFLYGKHVETLLGKSKSYAYKIISEIKSKRLNNSNTPITIYEFADFFNINVEEVIKAIQKSKQNNQTI